jgi:hypothetical protein
LRRESEEKWSSLAQSAGERQTNNQTTSRRVELSAGPAASEDALPMHKVARVNPFQQLSHGNVQPSQERDRSMQSLSSMGTVSVNTSFSLDPLYNPTRYSQPRATPQDHPLFPTAAVATPAGAALNANQAALKPNRSFISSVAGSPAKQQASEMRHSVPARSQASLPKPFLMDDDEDLAERERFEAAKQAIANGKSLGAQLGTSSTAVSSALQAEEFVPQSESLSDDEEGVLVQRTGPAPQPTAVAPNPSRPQTVAVPIVTVSSQAVNQRSHPISNVSLVSSQVRRSVQWIPATAHKSK